MFQRTDPRILRGPQSRSWSWPLLYLSHDESRLYTVSTGSRERRKIHQKRRCIETTSVTFVLSALHCRNPALAPPETHEGRSALPPTPGQQSPAEASVHSRTMSPLATQGMLILEHILFFCIFLHSLSFSSFTFSS